MKAQKNSGSIRKVLIYIRPHLGWFILSLLFAAASVAMSLYIPILIGNAIDLIPGVMSVQFEQVARVLVKIGICIAIGAVTQWLMNVCNNRIAYLVVRNIRNEAFEKLQKLPIRYLDSHRTGETVSKIITDVEQFADGLLMGFSQFFTGILTIVGTLAFMLSLNVKITLVVVLVTPLSLFVAAFIAKRTHSMFVEQSKTRAEQTAFIDEIISNQKTVKAFNHEDEASAEFADVNERLRKCSLKATFFSSLTNPSTRFINSIVYTGVALVGALVCLGSGGIALTVGELSCFLSYANQYTKPFNEISGVVTELQNALACASRVFELIDEPAQTPDKTDAVVISDCRDGIDFNDVSFSYTPEQRLIEHLNLNVKKGQRIAIVGPTGCGKTTLINLLMRFYDVCDGSIAVDKTDIRDITRDSLRSAFGMVLQDTWLRSGTIRENITFGKPDATEEEIIAAAKLSHAHSFIKRLPQGYDTVIGEGGGMLSQGQKQLLCITRVMLCLPPLLILDEATSSIDTRTEMRIQSAFSEMMKGRTSFIVAHRLSTIKEADVILVMKDGNIIEQGSHEELLQKGGFYHTLYYSQFEQ